MAVGGVDDGKKTSAAVHKYNSTTNSWDLISNMPTSRHEYLVAVLPTNEMMVVGGHTISSRLLTDKIETASIIYIA